MAFLVFAPNEKENLLNIVAVVLESLKAVSETNKLKKYVSVVYLTRIIFDTFWFSHSLVF